MQGHPQNAGLQILTTFPDVPMHTLVEKLPGYMYEKRENISWLEVQSVAQICSCMVWERMGKEQNTRNVSD